jgi:2-methylisocitrate lyase-like PEP mutase family enzyme
MSPTVAERRARFTELHRGPGCFVMPNPWDVGSTVYLGSLGFKALATTSAGMAFAAGLPDNGVTLAYALRHIGELVAATPLPVNADFEAGFAATPDDVHQNARLCIGMGVAGFSIEDYTGDAKAPFYGFAESVDRIRAARAAIDASGERVLLTARSETIWAGHPDGLQEALRRLAAFAEAGADVLFAPGLKTPDSVAEVVRAAGGLPVNVVVGAPGFTHRQLEDLGVRRISTGAGLARAAWGAFIRAAEEIAGEGRFDAFAEGASAARLNELFRSRAIGDEGPPATSH